jgi:hypothetical protein
MPTQTIELQHLHFVVELLNYVREVCYKFSIVTNSYRQGFSSVLFTFVCCFLISK